MNKTDLHVTANSKEVKPGSIFFAIKGAKFDGHDFIADAFKSGAAEVYAENDVGDARVKILGKNTRKKLGEMASEMHGHPTLKLKMVGVTGTSGKTTTTYLIQHLLNSEGKRCARLGTNGAEFEGKTWDTINTTPDALSLQKWFKEVFDLGATHVVMEASSHAIDQERVWGILWDAVVFLNLSAEHMDYHVTLDAYLNAKARLFTDHLEYSKVKNPRGFVNSDSIYGQRLLKLNQNLFHFSPASVNSTEYESTLYGNFQLENVLAAVTVAKHLGCQSWQKNLKNFPGVPGRMESIQNNHGILIFVDYAHKPEALEKVLLAIQGKPIITVFGCGGDRDRTKRPVMGEIACRLSTHVIITSDNPRTEDPLKIIEEIKAGITKNNYQNFEVMEDRNKAIHTAIHRAKKGDIILIAGKGHEDYQIIRNPDGTTKKIHFDDREVAREALTKI